MWNWIEFFVLVAVLIGLMKFVLWVGEQAERRKRSKREEGVVDSE